MIYLKIKKKVYQKLIYIILNKLTKIIGAIVIIKLTQIIINKQTVKNINNQIIITKYPKIQIKASKVLILNKILMIKKNQHLVL